MDKGLICIDFAPPQYKSFYCPDDTEGRVKNVALLDCWFERIST